MANRSYGQGVASITSAGGPELRFLLNPSSVQWGFEVNTAVFDTVGGRVVQVLGANVSDLVVSGTIGMSSSQEDAWRQAEGFASRIKDLVEWQSRDATIAGRKMQPPLVFSFPPKNWLFEVYIKAATDPQGAGIATHSSGKFSYDYQITMSVQNDLRNTSRIVGNSNGDLKVTKDKAVADYINSIANGIDWKISKYNGDYEMTGTAVTTGFETGAGPATVAVGSASGSSVTTDTSSSAETTGSNSGTKLSTAQISSTAKKAGFSDDQLKIMTAIAMAESGGNPSASNHNTNGTWDRGLFQINDVHKDIIAKYGGNRNDPDANAKMAYDIYKMQGYQAWSTYNNGAYLKFM